MTQKFHDDVETHENCHTTIKESFLDAIYGAYVQWVGNYTSHGFYPHEKAQQAMIADTKDRAWARINQRIAQATQDENKIAAHGRSVAVQNGSTLTMEEADWCGGGSFQASNYVPNFDKTQGTCGP